MRENECLILYAQKFGYSRLIDLVISIENSLALHHYFHSIAIGRKMIVTIYAP